MSKATDYYPGTTERVCLIVGTVEAILKVHDYVMEKILEKPDPALKVMQVAGQLPPGLQPGSISGPVPLTLALAALPTAGGGTPLQSGPPGGSPMGREGSGVALAAGAASAWGEESEAGGGLGAGGGGIGTAGSGSPLGALSVQAQSISRLLLERHKQVKLLVPNSTAGMIIGKGGAFIKELKERANAFIQISQKPRELALQERCITIAGLPSSSPRRPIRRTHPFSTISQFLSARSIYVYSPLNAHLLVAQFRCSFSGYNPSTLFKVPVLSIRHIKALVKLSN